MLKVVMISLFLMAYAQSIVGQSVLLNAFPKVKVILSNESVKRMRFDEIRIAMKLENISAEVQEILFDKPDRIGPWGTFVTIINEKGDTVSAKVNREMLSSTLYTAEQLKMQKAFYNLLPHGMIQRSFKLSDMVILTNFEQGLAAGKYRVSLSYYGNRSNTLVLNIL